MTGKSEVVLKEHIFNEKSNKTAYKVVLKKHIFIEKSNKTTYKN
jgi:hypothetical protein